MNLFYLRSLLCASIICAFFSSADCSNHVIFSKKEKNLIETGDSTMHLYVNTNKKELKLLRKKSHNLDFSMLQTAEYQQLKQRMHHTVKDPGHPGVGIAAPQVGISRKLVAVQRFDKTDKPFEFYPNIEIIQMSDTSQIGPEGCLSVPNRRGLVKRASNIKIRYMSENTGEWKEECISGFTAVIFQHEVDHLSGILYIDKLENEISDK